MMSKFNIDKESDITDEIFFKNRRKIIAASLSAPLMLGLKNIHADNQSFLFTKDLIFPKLSPPPTIKNLISFILLFIISKFCIMFSSPENS